MCLPIKNNIRKLKTQLNNNENTLRKRHIKASKIPVSVKIFQFMCHSGKKCGTKAAIDDTMVIAKT